MTGIEVYETGQSADMTRVITEEDILRFAEITGDRNPVHISEEFASQTRFGERIAHGILTAGLISAVIGTKLPGPGCLYLSQTLVFRAPVKIGDEITVGEKSQKVQAISDSLETVIRRGLPQWLDLEKDKMKGTVKSLPVREDLTTPMQEQLIVELYSK